MRTYRHASLMAAMCAAPAGMIVAAEEAAGIPPLEPETRRKGKGHQHKREIARRLRQQARLAEKRARTGKTPRADAVAAVAKEGRR